jgi:hypothetical protein
MLYYLRGRFQSSAERLRVVALAAGHTVLKGLSHPGEIGWIGTMELRHRSQARQTLEIIPIAVKYSAVAGDSML